LKIKEDSIQKMNNLIDDLSNLDEDLQRLEEDIRKRYNKASNSKGPKASVTEKNKSRFLSSIQKSVSGLKGTKSQLEYLKTSSEMEVVSFSEDVDSANLSSSNAAKKHSTQFLKKFLKHHKQIDYNMNKMTGQIEEINRGIQDCEVDLEDIDQLG